MQSEETGEFKQVGSSCLIDFLGHTDPHAIAEYAEMIAIFDEDYSKDESFYLSAGMVPKYVSLKRFLAKVSASIRHDGWTSKKTVYERGGYATSNSAYSACFAIAKDSDYITTIKNDWDIAEKTIEWVLGHADNADNNDYMHNLVVVFAEEYISRQHSGIAASAVYSYQREKATKETGKESNFVGEIKKRQTFTLNWVNTFSFETQYGVNHINKFLDDEGNTIIWKTGTRDFSCMDETRFSGVATVKEHSVYRGKKQTLITRAKLESVQ